MRGFAPRGSFHPATMLGALIWVAIATGFWIGRLRLSVVELLFLLAPLVAVPLAISLIPPVDDSWRIAGRSVGLNWIILAAAALTALSFFQAEGLRAAMLASAWFLVCSWLTVEGLRRILRYRAQSFSQFCFAVGEAYLVVGGTWFVASRRGLQPFGFQEPVVLLTAVHFHFAGFLSAVLAGLTYERFRESRWDRPLRVALASAVIGPGLLGLAFLAGPKLKLAAVMLIVAGQFGLAAGTICVAARMEHSAGRALLFLSSGCVLAGMVLAATWAMGEYPLHPFVDLARMEKYHGVLNAVGFGVCGLLGWANAVGPKRAA
jgi:YndJ-like protein